MKIPALNYTNATVIHTNKYNQNNGFIFACFFLSNVVLDVVFRIDETGEEFSTSYVNPGTILYPQQKIVLVSVDGNVIAYIDNAAGRYYYLNNSLAQVLSYSININWSLLIILTFVFFIMLQQFSGVYNEYSVLIFFIPVALWIYEKIMNGYIEAAVDKEIEKHFI
jgi:diacylglycerol kinase